MVSGQGKTTLHLVFYKIQRLLCGNKMKLTQNFITRRPPILKVMQLTNIQTSDFFFKFKSINLKADSEFAEKMS